ncbi:biotin-[acetyl-CoA-carboxylase] ligase [Candidatus Nitrososphaera gargensis Ga9.2]|uniref:Biotin-[acetyl-CoA-carboxylase] ligase n=1 Tax=Nitrososphaera gargensis (strain Ga9.2) TaxID=1237085 RepID=K0IJT4_NITGG|nr:biotin--[acetyl-CoA-carboxylase] ligase [Candidatus Nitrososphaera gargensis]AFU58532.1 biotin-[acetyl-CoA-carboxylase] ligase [Candidatus Nitrososphaera gargensis Ga9.2]
MPQPEAFVSLLRSEPGYISGQALAKKAGISRSAVWKQIRMLRRYGYTIESRHGLGYRLAGQTDLPVPWELARVLRTSFIGKHVVYKETTDSTQNIAISLADRSDSHGTVVIAEQQKSGRGRQKRKWLSPKGGIWLSVVLKPGIPTAKITLLPFVAALAVCDAIKNATGLDARLKWPNDVMISGKKVAGILLDISAEADQINYAVIGIGINANVDSAAISARLDGTKITSISDELGHSTSRLDLTRSLLENLEHYYLEMEQQGVGTILQKWKKRSDMLGRKVAVVQNNNKIIQGMATDINDDGSLLLKTDVGDVNVVSGDIHVRY